MKYQHPLALHHSWPLIDRARHFDLGWVDRSDVRPPVASTGGPIGGDEELTRRGVGVWRCDLADDTLSWSPVIYDIFNIPRGAAVTRADAVAQYCEPSRAAMERLRAHAIQHCRGFTLDVEIGPAQAQRHWVRLIAAPICDAGTVVGLHGLKWRIDPDHR